MSLRGQWRLAAMGMATILGLARRGWFIPYRYAAGLPRAGASPAYAPIETLFQNVSDELLSPLAALDGLADRLRAIGETGAAKQAPGGPRWRQGWFPPLDAAIAYAMVAQHKPRLIVEVGSGHSTRFLARAVADGGLATRIVAIDPAPRASLAGLAPAVELLPRIVHQAGAAAFAALGAGDMLFIDSSHILMPGSDVDFLFNRILPTLPAGVLVHIHDVTLPDDYPRAWAWRGYNEQLAVIPLLLSGAWRALFASHFVATRHGAALARSPVAGLPHLPGAFPTSLWLQKAR